MQSHEIEHYLAELGAALQSQGITKPVRLLLIGGAYMMRIVEFSCHKHTFAHESRPKGC